MRRLHNTKWLPPALAKPTIFITISIILLLLLLAGCSGEPEVVEVTRVVTETEAIEAEPIEVEVTRVVTETVTETVEVEAEGEADGEPPSATGSEDDSGPLPPEPDDGPKVISRNGSSFSQEVALETAVPLRANQNEPASQPTPVTFVSGVDPNMLQKLCHLIEKTFKKKCN